jgi:8-oxo-dGTP pyrophosphatase MutT (NUDIX family)
MSKNNPIPIVVAVVRDKHGNLLLAKRRDKKFDKANGLWELPGGHIEFKEDSQKAAVRECLEETGLKIKVIRLLPRIYNNFWTDKKGKNYHTILISYECQAVGGKLHDKKHDYKISELCWIKPKDLVKYKLLPKTREIVDLLKK